MANSSSLPDTDFTFPVTVRLAAVSLEDEEEGALVSPEEEAESQGQGPKTLFHLALPPFILR